MNEKTPKVETEEIIFERVGHVGHVTLNRPYALNALTQPMVLALDAHAREWAADDAIKATLIRARQRPDGRAVFCSGGDIRLLHQSHADPERRFAVEFYAQEYHLNTFAFRYPKPYVALIDGVVMGGGVGISILGSHRVMTERTLFAMPETGIGLFPDVGATYFLPRCPGKSGLYLGLTGARIEAADCVCLGLGTHFVPSDRLDAFDETMLAADLSGDAAAKIETILADTIGDPGEPPIKAHMDAIDRCFDAGSVEEIVENLKGEGTEWAGETLKTLAQKSPTSLKVTFRQLTQYGDLEFEDAMKIEYRIAIACNFGHEFSEGIRAQIVDKDRNPKWDPPTLEAVTDEIVDRHFQAPVTGDLTFD